MKLFLVTFSMGPKQKLPEETESSLEMKKYKIPCSAWCEGIMY